MNVANPNVDRQLECFEHKIRKPGTDSLLCIGEAMEDWGVGFSLPASTRHQMLLLRRCPGQHISQSRMAPAASVTATATKSSDLSQNVAAGTSDAIAVNLGNDGVNGLPSANGGDAPSRLSTSGRSKRRMLRIQKTDADQKEDASSRLCTSVGSDRRMLIREGSPILLGHNGKTTGLISKPLCKSPPKKRLKAPPDTGIIPCPLVATKDRKLPSALLCTDFFKVDALDLAPRLLGKYLRRDDVVLQITEVEAYRPNDSACHGRFGVTARTAPVFGPGGHAYVYLCYGLHIMLNIVADLEGIGAAVLIRSCAPIAGMKIIQSRRGLLSDKPVLLTGPGKVGQALGLTTEWSNHPLFVPGASTSSNLD